MAARRDSEVRRARVGVVLGKPYREWWSLKVTDKRMFTPDGRLREEYEGLDAPGAQPVEAPAAVLESPEPAEPESPVFAETPAPAGYPGSGPGETPPLEIPTGGAALNAPGFYDLVALLAEPASLYLGDLTLPDGSSAENLEMARLHIDLLAVLRQRTAGNLSAQESAFLEDLLYRFRVRFVQKRG
jgi:hypothetical protein